MKKSKKIIMMILVVILIGMISSTFYISNLTSVSYALSKYGSRGEEVRKIQAVIPAFVGKLIGGNGSLV